MDDLEQLLRTSPPPEPDAALYGALMARFETRHGVSGWLSWLWPFGPVWQPAVSLVVVALLGFAIAPQQSTDAATQFAAIDFDTLVLGENYDAEVSP